MDIGLSMQSMSPYPYSSPVMHTCATSRPWTALSERMTGPTFQTLNVCYPNIGSALLGTSPSSAAWLLAAIASPAVLLPVNGKGAEVSLLQCMLYAPLCSALDAQHEENDCLLWIVVTLLCTIYIIVTYWKDDVFNSKYGSLAASAFLK